jgi:pimeloyl-ACP methyl ester carboxylesterase
MYLECRGAGSPTVVLVSGLDAAADLWHRDEQPAPKVFPKVAEFTRVCAYDRPGTPYGTGLPSRSDPVAQPITPGGSVEASVETSTPSTLASPLLGPVPVTSAPCPARWSHAGARRHRRS